MDTSGRPILISMPPLKLKRDLKARPLNRAERRKAAAKRAKGGQ